MLALIYAEQNKQNNKPLEGRYKTFNIWGLWKAGEGCIISSYFARL